MDTSKPIEAQWHQAAKVGDLTHMKALLGQKPELLGHHQKGIGHTALHWAASSGQLEVVEWLLAGGFSPIDARNSGESTPLHSAAGGGALAVVERLLAAGADRKAVDEDGETPASLARTRGHAEIAALLA